VAALAAGRHARTTWCQQWTVSLQTFPPSLLVSGLVYDVNTGLVEGVVPSATE
jgi:hypothetical protein